ncbi:SDR family oxidoreductase, partial [Thioclava sp. BHET1]
MAGDDRGSVLVTGCASGIGLAIAGLLQAEGWRPWLLDLRPEALAAACAELGLPAARGLACDVAREEEVEAAFARVSDDLRGVVCSAGIAVDCLMVDTRSEDFRRILDVNLVGSFHIARAAARRWIAKAEAGAIVNI